MQSNAAASGDETLEPASSAAPLADRSPLSVPSDEPAAGALQELPARQVWCLRCPGWHVIGSRWLLSSIAMFPLNSRSSNGDQLVIVTLVLDGAAANTERSADSCTRPLSSNSSSSRRSPTRLGSAPRAGRSSSSRSVRSFSSSSSNSRSPTLLDLGCKVGSPETLLARLRFVFLTGKGNGICFCYSSSVEGFSMCNGLFLCV